MLFFLAESFLIFSSVVLAVHLRFVFQEGLDLNYITLLKAVIITAVCQMCLSYNDLYILKNGRYFQHLAPRLIQSMIAAALILTVLYYFSPELTIGRGVFLISLSLCPLLLFSWRYVYRWMIDKRLLNNERILIVGSGPLAIEIGTEILSMNSLGYHIVGFIDKDPAMVGVKILNPSIIGAYVQLPEIAQEERINRIIVALPEQRGSLPIDALLRCKLSGIRSDEGISFFEQMTGKIHLENLKPSWLIFSDGFKIQKSKKIIKRSMDIFFSVTGLILAVPLFLVISLLIRLDSSGPVFYRQERIGENGKKFSLLKFRSMEADAEADLVPVWAQEGDTRVTRIGKFLRRTRMDELPQLFNVLRGEMSFVGPRPERPWFVEQLEKEIPYYRLRFSIKPGITGWAQIKYQYGSSVKDAIEKLQYELYYIKNLSFSLDLAILFSTIKVVLSGKGAR